MQVRHLPWGAITVQGAHDKAKIVASSVHQVAFGNIVRASERHPGQVATAFDESETSLHQPRAETTQPFALVASGAATIGVEFPTGNHVAMPAATLRDVLLRDVGRDSLITVETLDQFGFVIALIRHGAKDLRSPISEACKIIAGSGQDALKCRAINVQAQALPPDGEAGMIRRGLVKSNAEKGSQRKPVLTVPGDGPVRGEAFQVADEQHPEVDSGRNRRSAGVDKKGGAEIFGPGIETVFGQEFIEPGVKGMPLALGKLRVVDPHCLLPGCALAHCHTV